MLLRFRNFRVVALTLVGLTEVISRGRVERIANFPHRLATSDHTMVSATRASPAHAERFKVR
eukprot:5089940-Amphidinium_carterae.2